ncbi:Coiled-coil protein [Giardia muris]|uniref:Coiled-coil protein n=1 Tax=Giardia muris TaxID=5742 RepID=A0A4Z1SRG9_GIAMU|nr:Coiled-coil protein [Giardia muris]|eukprot:TNJ28320.1 Coiled-coil protein [Giardia muris]
MVAPIRVGSTIVSSQNTPGDLYNELYTFGIDTNGFSNLAHLSNRYLVFASGNAICAMDTETGARTAVPSFTMGGVTTLAVTHDHSHLAVGFASRQVGALVYIFRISIDRPGMTEGDFPIVEMIPPDAHFELLPPIEISAKMHLIHEVTLKSVGKLGVAAMSFNHDSTLLAIVSCSPDYQLSIYDWQHEKLLLKAPAFTSDVYRVSFCRYTLDALITGGKNHLKLWEMAMTFTGPKLQGELAKFGILDSSDCTAFLELPSGNTLSGCGTGEIVLWEATTVRIVFQRPGGRRCHDGRVEFLYCDLDGLFTRSAAAVFATDDGSFEKPSTTHKPTLLYYNLLLRGIPSASDGWFTSEGGADQQRKTAQEGVSSAQLADGFDESHVKHFLPVIVTAGSDGYVRLWSGHEILQSQFKDNGDSVFFEITPVEEIYIGPGSCIRTMSLSPDSYSIAMQDAGAGGIIIVDIATRNLRRICCGHGGSVRSIACMNTYTDLNLSGTNADTNAMSMRSGLVATLGDSGVVFLHDLAARKLVSMKVPACGRGTKLIFIHNGICLVVGYTDGSVRFYSVFYEPPKTTEEEDEVSELEDCLFLIKAFKCFNDPVVDITCSSEGLVTILSANGQLFLVRTSLSLVRQGLPGDITTSLDEQEKLSALARGLLNVKDAEAEELCRKELEINLAGAKGTLGMTTHDVLPLGYFDLHMSVFKESAEKTMQRLRNLFFVTPTLLAMTVTNCSSPENRIAAIPLPSLSTLLEYRKGARDEPVVSAVEEPASGDSIPVMASSISYDLSSLITGEPRFLSIHIPATPLPGTCEATIAKVEKAVVQKQINAMLPSRGAVESAMDALLAMEMEEEKEEQESDEEEEEEEYDEEGNLIEKPKKKKIDPNDPVYEDTTQPQNFDFVQFSIVTGPDSDPMSSRVLLLVNLFVEEEIRNRAESAMANVRARAESNSAASMASVGDPAVFCAALAVAEARATYRSSLIYSFDYSTICTALLDLHAPKSTTDLAASMRGEGQGKGKTSFLRPTIVIPAAHRGPILDAPSLKESELADPEFEPPHTTSIGLLVRRPIAAYAIPTRGFVDYITDDLVRSEVAEEGRKRSEHTTSGAIFTLQDGGSLTVEPLVTTQELTDLRQHVIEDESNLTPLAAMHLREANMRWWSTNCSQCVPGGGLCAMNIGFGGHVCIVGDAAGNLFAFGTRMLEMLLDKLRTAYLDAVTTFRNPQLATFNGNLCSRYVRDKIYSTDMKSIKPALSLLINARLYSLVPEVPKQRSEQMLNEGVTVLEAEDLNKQDLPMKTQEPVADQMKSAYPTLEEARISELDAVATKLGQESKHAVLLKMDNLRGLYATLVRTNAAFPIEKRLFPHEFAPDLLLANEWLAREERRAHILIYDEYRPLFQSVVEKIDKLLEAFPIAEPIYSVRAFANPAQQVSTFKCLPLTKQFERSLCEALGISSIDNVPSQVTSQDPTHSEASSDSADSFLDAPQPVAESEDLAVTAETQLQASTIGNSQPRSAKAPIRTNRGTGTKTLKTIDKIIAQTLSNKLGESLKQGLGDDVASDGEIRQQRVMRRAEARQKRKDELRALLNRKPDPDKISSEDESSLQQSNATFGIFHLKTTSEYVQDVGRLTQEYERALEAGEPAQPCNPYENKDGRWLQFLLVLKGMHDARKEFNERVAILFACKQAVVLKVTQLKEQALHLSAVIRQIVGPEVAAEIDSVLAGDEFFSDPDKLTAMISMHPNELQHLRFMELHDRYITNWLRSGFAEGDSPEKLDNMSYCLRLLRCFIPDPDEVEHSFSAGDVGGQELLENYLNHCVSSHLIPSEVAEQLRTVARTKPVRLESMVRQIVIDTSEALGGLNYGIVPHIKKVAVEEAEDGDDSSFEEMVEDGSDDSDEAEPFNLSRPYVKTEALLGIPFTALNGTLQQSRTGIALDTETYSGHPLREATCVQLSNATTLAPTVSAIQLHAEALQYNLRSLLLPCNNPHVGVHPGTMTYSAVKAVSVFYRQAVTTDQARRARSWVKVILHFRSVVINTILALALRFDAVVRDLQYSGVELQQDFSRIQIRLISLFQQAEIHHLYITRDAQSLAHLEACKADHHQIAMQLEQLRKQIIAKTEEASAVGQSLQKLLKEFNNAISAEAPFRSKLVKVYMKKFRAARAARQVTEAGDFDPTIGTVGPNGKKTIGSTNPDDYMVESDESSELSNLSEGGGEDDDDEPVDETVAPEGVSNELFNFVLNLRAKKREYDSQLATIYQASEQLKYQYSALQKKEKTTLAVTETANRELTQFRAGKQKELNAVQTASLVTLGQFAYLDSDSMIRPDLTQALLFDMRAIQILKSRITLRLRQLRHCYYIGETLKDSYCELVQREKNAQKELQVYSDKLVSVQLLKFGRTLDIAKLDSVCINEQAEELARILNEEELEFKRDQLYKETILERGKDQLKYALDKNTDLVMELAQLERESLALDRAILARQRRAPKAWCSDNKNELIRQEYNTLKREIINRERELRTLVDEIAILKSHGN